MTAELVTDRLRLRPLRPDDVSDLHRRIYSDPEVTWNGSTYSLEEARTALELKQRHVQTHGFGMLAVTDRETGEFFGYAGLQHLEGGPEVELGYYLARAAWGRGLATELSRALLERAFGEMGLERVVAVVRPRNAASKHVLAKAGLTPVGPAHHYGEDVELWEVTSVRGPEEPRST